ncbi:MAG: hypothetical protein Q4B09_02905 [Lachnospiraceae bacterium]|nr:hypothetical protein [Lachnospiraceae bacterium]
MKQKRQIAGVTALLCLLQLFPMQTAAESSYGAGSLPEEPVLVGAPPEKKSSDGGAYLNILSSDKICRLLMKHYVPGYVEDAEGNASIGDVTIRWFQTPYEDGRYQNRLDAVLPVNEFADPQDRIDLFLLTDRDMSKYIRTDYALEFDRELGIKEEEFPKGFSYADCLTADAEGNRKAAAVVLSPGFFYYNREAAVRVVGSSDYEVVQEAAADWETLYQTGKAAKALSVPLFSSAEELFPLFSGSRTTAWVRDDTVANPILTVPQELKNWAELSAFWQKEGFFEGEEKPLFKAGASPGSENTEITPAADVGMVRGPAFWQSGTIYLLCAAGTDNADLAAMLIRTLCCDETRLQSIAAGSGFFMNTEAGMQAVAEGYSSLHYDGQNSFALMLEAAEALGEAGPQPRTRFDLQLDELYKDEMKAYIGGSVDYEEAEAAFYAAAQEFIIDEEWNYEADWFR